MLKWILSLFARARKQPKLARMVVQSCRVVREQQPGESCLSCCQFIDHRDREDPDDEFGYCGELVDRLGLEEAIKVNPYGGHWTHSGDWCEAYKEGSTLWPMEEHE